MGLVLKVPEVQIPQIRKWNFGAKGNKAEGRPLETWNWGPGRMAACFDAWRFVCVMRVSVKRRTFWSMESAISRTPDPTPRYRLGPCKHQGEILGVRQVKGLSAYPEF